MGRDRDREPVTLQLWLGRRRVGDPVSAWVDWRGDHEELRRLLVDAAVKRAGYPQRRIGEFRLEVLDERGRRHLTDFVTTYDERRDR